MKIIANFGIFWAVFMPLFLMYQEITDSGPISGIDLMAQNLHGAGENQTGNSIVSLPASAMTNWANTLHQISMVEDQRSAIFLTFAFISSFIIMVVAVISLKNCKSAKQE